MGNYYKIPPEWAGKLGVSGYAAVHPDGWVLIMPPVALRLTHILAPKEDGTPWGLDEAVTAIGGVIYTLSEALASQRGEAQYMMGQPTTPDSPVYNTDGTEYTAPAGTDSESAGESSDAEAKDGKEEVD